MHLRPERRRAIDFSTASHCGRVH